MLKATKNFAALVGALVTVAGLLTQQGVAVAGDSTGPSPVGHAHPTPPSEARHGLAPQRAADLRATAIQDSCAQVRSNLSTFAAQGKSSVICTKSTTLKPSQISLAATEPLPEWCADLPDGNWWFFRNEACQVAGLEVDVVDTESGAVTGTLDSILLGYSFTDDTTLVWGFQEEIDPFAVTGTAATGMVVQGNTSCVGQCTLLDGPLPSQPVSTTQAAEKLWFPEGTSTAAGAVGFGNIEFSFFFTHPGALPSNVISTTPPPVRCDNALPGKAVPGCIFPDYIPVMTYSLTGAYPELARHINDAQASGLPGAYPSGAPLSRLTDPTLRTQNGNTACKASYPRPAGKSCDEYPFRSTWQGAFTGGGDPRTFSWCQVTLAGPGSTGSSGYSVCMINSTQNSAGGSALGLFYNSNRVLERDLFRVWITP